MNVEHEVFCSNGAQTKRSLNKKERWSVECRPQRTLTIRSVDQKESSLKGVFKGKHRLKGSVDHEKLKPKGT